MAAGARTALAGGGSEQADVMWPPAWLRLTRTQTKGSCTVMMPLHRLHHDERGAAAATAHKQIASGESGHDSADSCRSFVPFQQVSR